MENQDLKKLKEYSNAALVSSILLLVFGFGFGVVNMAFFLIALASAGFGLARNKENIRSVKKKCVVAIIIVLIAVSIFFAGIPSFADFVINPSSFQKIGKITKQYSHNNYNNHNNHKKISPTAEVLAPVIHRGATLIVGTANDEIIIWGENFVRTTSGIHIEIFKNGNRKGIINSPIYIRSNRRLLRFILKEDLINNIQPRTYQETYQIYVVNDNGRSNPLDFTIFNFSASSMNASNWKTYKSKYGFSLNYPENWIAKDTFGGGIVISTPKGVGCDCGGSTKSYPGFMIDISVEKNKDNKTLLDLKREKESFGCSTVKIEKINEVDMLFYKNCPDCCNFFPGFKYVNQKYIYDFYSTYSFSSPNDNLEKNNSKLFESIIRTIRFEQQNPQKGIESKKNHS